MHLVESSGHPAICLKDKYHLTDREIIDNQLDHQVEQLMEDHFRVYANRMEWYSDGKLVLTVPYDNSFLPRLTVFPAGISRCSSGQALLP